MSVNTYVCFLCVGIIFVTIFCQTEVSYFDNFIVCKQNVPCCQISVNILKSKKHDEIIIVSVCNCDKPSHMAKNFVPIWRKFQTCYFHLILNPWINTKLGHHWLRKWLGPLMAPSHYLKHCWWLTTKKHMRTIFTRETWSTNHQNQLEHYLSKFCSNLPGAQWFNSERVSMRFHPDVVRILTLRDAKYSIPLATWNE